MEKFQNTKTHKKKSHKTPPNKTGHTKESVALDFLTTPIAE